MCIKFNFSNRVHPLSLSILLIASSMGCTVYEPASSNLSDSVEQGKAKVVSKAGTDFRFMNIEFIDGNYFGVYGPKDNRTVLLLDEQIEGIYLRNKKLSLILNIVGTLVFISIFYVIWLSTVSIGFPSP